MQKRNRISESLIKSTVRKALLETAIDELANYPQSFSMEEFKKLTSFNARVQYCNQRLERLGSGSGRIVYRIDDATVLKLARNNKGVAQNEAEADDWYARQNGLTTEVYDTDENHLWIEMQLARKARAADFRRLTGHDFRFMCGFVDYVRSLYARRTMWGPYVDKETYDAFVESGEFEDSFFYYLYDYMTNMTLEAVGDLKRPSSWGVVTDPDGEERLVIVDMGLNDTVYNDYYNGR